jgi:hypothetical protein
MSTYCSQTRVESVALELNQLMMRFRTLLFHRILSRPYSVTLDVEENLINKNNYGALHPSLYLSRVTAKNRGLRLYHRDMMECRG